MSGHAAQPMEETKRSSCNHSLSAVAHPQFLVQIRRVPAHRSRRNAQLYRDLFVGQALCQQRKHIQFSRCERFYQRRLAGSTDRLGSCTLYIQRSQDLADEYAGF